jgi:hypothetical protein
MSHGLWRNQIENILSKALAFFATLAPHSTQHHSHQQKRVGFLLVLDSTFESQREKKTVTRVNDLFCEWFLAELKMNVQAAFTRTFWQPVNPEIIFVSCNADDDMSLIVESLEERIATVYHRFDDVQTLAKEIMEFTSIYRLEEGYNQASNSLSLVQQASSMFTAMVSSQIPAFIPDVVYMFIVVNFAQHKSICGHHSQQEVPHAGLTGESLFSSFRTTLSQMRQLRWVDIVDSALTKVLHVEIQRLVRQECSGEFESPMLDTLKSFMNTTIKPWLEIVFFETVYAFVTILSVSLSSPHPSFFLSWSYVPFLG